MSNQENKRDRIDVYRTFQANERTLVEYLSTGLCLLVAGIVIVCMSHEYRFEAAGIGCMPVAVIIAVVGMARFRNMKKHITHIQEQLNEAAKSKEE